MRTSWELITHAWFLSWKRAVMLCDPHYAHRDGEACTLLASSPSFLLSRRLYSSSTCLLCSIFCSFQSSFTSLRSYPCRRPSLFHNSLTQLTWNNSSYLSFVGFLSDFVLWWSHLWVWLFVSSTSLKEALTVCLGIKSCSWFTLTIVSPELN
jgi:hypothetical protein